MISNYFRRRTLILDNAVKQLFKSSRRNMITENELREAFRRYNLRHALITIGSLSSAIFFGNVPNKIGKHAFNDPKTGTTISQYALSYLANILLTSNANDYKSALLTDGDDNITVLCSIYNSLQDPLLDAEIGDKGLDDLHSFLIRTYYEQLDLQLSGDYLIAKDLTLFRDLSPTIEDDGIGSLAEVFQNSTGLSFEEYFQIGFLIFTYLQHEPIIRISAISRTSIPELKIVIKEESIRNFINSLKSNYPCFRREDEEINCNMDQRYTKSRYNPLIQYPIVETNSIDSNERFVIPNTVNYSRKVFGGLFWWFHRYFEDQGKHLDFRTYFGKVFHEYVGLILYKIFGSEHVHREIFYGSGIRFVDWWVERGDKVYLFEVKTYQFALESKRTGLRESVVDNEVPKIIDAIRQVHARIKDIGRYQELCRFETKEIIPFIVFMDIPFVSTPLFATWIHEALEEVERSEGISGLSEFRVNLMNMMELEVYDTAATDIELDALFDELAEGDFSKSLISIMEEQTGKPGRNEYLDSVWKQFSASLIDI